MSLKFNNVQHFKLKHSRLLDVFIALINLVALALIVLSDLNDVFTVLLCLLVALFYIYFRINRLAFLKISNIELRNNKIYIQLNSSSEQILVSIAKLKQTRWFTDIRFTNDTMTQNVFLLPDNFKTIDQFHNLMQAIRNLRD